MKMKILRGFLELDIIYVTQTSPSHARFCSSPMDIDANIIEFKKESVEL